MSDLNELVEQAYSADPAERIYLRDRIAAHGARAIPFMRSWLADARLCGFAVRVLERVASEPDARAAVVSSLKVARNSDLPEHGKRDVEEALARLGVSSRGESGSSRPRPTSPAWPGDRKVSALELAFHDAMLDVFRLAGEATRRRRPDGTYERGYWASYFLRGVRSHGGRDYARQLLHQAGTTDGFERLRMERKLYLTMEALVIRPEFKELFTEEERQVASRRLALAGYQPNVP